MTCSQFLTRGSTSSGTLTIDSNLKMNISVSPYAVTAEDRSAIVKGMETFLNAIRNNPEITITQPADNVTVQDYVNNVSLPGAVLPSPSLPRSYPDQSIPGTRSINHGIKKKEKKATTFDIQDTAR